MSQPIVLGGRRFVRAGVSTLAHDVEFTELMTRAGLQEIEVEPGESPEQFGWRVIRGLTEAHAILPALACLIVPESELINPPRRGLARLLEHWGILASRAAFTGWSPEIQQQTIEFLGELTSEEDKQRVYALVAELLLPFCRSGLRSWASSLTSSSQEKTTAKAAESIPPPVGTARGEG